MQIYTYTFYIDTRCAMQKLKKLISEYSPFYFLGELYVRVEKQAMKQLYLKWLLKFMDELVDVPFYSFTLFIW